MEWRGFILLKIHIFCYIVLLWMHFADCFMHFSSTVKIYITKTHFIWQARWLLMPDSYLHLEFNVLPLKNGMLLTFSLPKSYFEVQLAVALIDKGLSYFYWIDFIAQFRAEIPHSRRCQVACQDSVWLLPRRFVCFDQSSFYGPLQPEVVYCLLQRCVAALAR